MAPTQVISARRLAALCASLAVLSALAFGAPAASDDYTDENRPYEFGFSIEGQQHRHEKKDERGIIMGEFGFITADGVYHVTVYATDENGDFKIISMKNIRLGPPLDQMRTAPRSSTTTRPVTQPPAAARVSAGPAASGVTSSTARAAVRLNGVNGCSGCLIPTTTVAPPPAIGSELQPPFVGGPASVGTPGQSGGARGGVSSGDRTPKVLSGGLSGSTGGGVQDRFGGGFTDRPGGSFRGGAPGSAAGAVGGITGAPVGGGSSGSFGGGAGGVGSTDRGGGGGGFGGQGAGLPGQPTVGIPAGPGRPPQPGGQQSSFGVRPGSSGGGAGGVGSSFGGQQAGPPGQPPVGIAAGPVRPSQQGGQQPPFGVRPSTVAAQAPSGGGASPGQPGAVPPTAFGGQASPPSTRQQGGARPAAFGQRPSSSGGADGGGNRTPAGEAVRDGLPPGVSMQDVMDALLYRFNYTLPYHGHNEEGYRSGSKVGGYFADGRDGVGRSVKYLANEFGYQPNITLVDLRPDQAHTEEDERSAPLLGYKFEWLY